MKKNNLKKISFALMIGLTSTSLLSACNGNSDKPSKPSAQLTDEKPDPAKEILTEASATAILSAPVSTDDNFTFGGMDLSTTLTDSNVATYQKEQELKKHFSKYILSGLTRAKAMELLETARSLSFTSYKDGGNLAENSLEAGVYSFALLSRVREVFEMRGDAFATATSADVEMIAKSEKFSRFAQVQVDHESRIEDLEKSAFATNLVISSHSQRLSRLEISTELLSIVMERVIQELAAQNKKIEAIEAVNLAQDNRITNEKRRSELASDIRRLELEILQADLRITQATAVQTHAQNQVNRAQSALRDAKGANIQSVQTQVAAAKEKLASANEELNTAIMLKSSLWRILNSKHIEISSMPQ